MLKLSSYDYYEDINVVFDEFPAGETLVRIEHEYEDAPKYIVIELKYESNEDLFNLMLLTDAVRRLWPLASVYLAMSYLPYARQDRVCNKGESLSVKVVADLINSLNFAAVACKDIHSEVGVALIDRLAHTEQYECAGNLLQHLAGDVVIVSPDAGANKKVYKFAQEYGFPHVVRADKVRNVLTGDIVETKVYSEHVGSKDFLILDDICDGGRTFIELAKELRKLTDGKIYLYVTHGIFSKGAEVFEGVLDGIFVSNLMGKPHQLIKEI